MFESVQTSRFVTLNSAKIVHKITNTKLQNYKSTNTQNFPKWNPNKRHSANPATLWDNSCSRNLKNYPSDVTFNYFYSDSRKVPRIKANVLTP